ncbi:protein-methionine-sulfoxide reductase heme-binding subunit MsrQ [Marinibactrum halimedae]|uniref:Protein-methionine-sulfoxide reductase heme-binding subunit MsrQ n=1 Tax=Marinibactrum halimedae TaxID=1444977 RepID=A0AA37T7I8_9GAMM|nr:protein-methionine-sulfoxide reductase heme-binding subunit MsrQ [Marinibactrum halimedae]MCD9459919.1 protein-methionine-sulfoxide reductase heme-binding subunit MsrQ [Marinibactrum halimedae]GLS25226.1 protein-methionine-sulfoxide reductase heme-binding subunit MsrQ [Marinibactrum halimedae]
MLKRNQLGNKSIVIIKTIIHAMCLYFLMSRFYFAFTDQLGGDPVQAIIHFTGMSAFKLLLLTLAVTPLAQWSQQGKLMRIRRMLGLWCFTFAVAHFYSYTAFDLHFDFLLLGSEVIKRPYITVGFFAWVLLMLLAITSLPILVRKLGKRWKRLHNWIYASALLIGVHFWWSVKADITEPVVYFVMVVGLLSLRWQKLKRYLGSARR